MTDDERVKLADMRRLVFANLARGVAMQTVMETFHLSEKEATDIFRMVGERIGQYRFERKMPYADYKSIPGAMKNCAMLLHSLGKIGPIALTTDPKLKVREAAFGTGGQMMEALMDNRRNRT